MSDGKGFIFFLLRLYSSSLDPIQGASFNNFLDGIDASYCTFEGGDDPIVDGIYPDPAPGGYKCEFNLLLWRVDNDRAIVFTLPRWEYLGQDCGKYKPAPVISTSYGYDEVDLTPKYMKCVLISLSAKAKVLVLMTPSQKINQTTVRRM